MATFPNQHCVLIHREKTGTQYRQVNMASGNNAMRNLNGSAFKLWYYLCGFRDNMRWELSPKAIMDTIGIPRRSYYTAKEELIAKGYLEIDEDNDKLWHFYEDL